MIRKDAAQRLDVPGAGFIRAQRLEAGRRCVADLDVREKRCNVIVVFDRFVFVGSFLDNFETVRQMVDATGDDTVLGNVAAVIVGGVNNVELQYLVQKKSWIRPFSHIPTKRQQKHLGSVQQRRAFQVAEPFQDVVHVQHTAIGELHFGNAVHQIAMRHQCEHEALGVFQPV